MYALSKGKLSVEVVLVLNTNHKTRKLMMLQALEATEKGIVKKLTKTALSQWKKHGLKRRTIRLLSAEGLPLDDSSLIASFKHTSRVVVVVANGERFAGAVNSEVAKKPIVTRSAAGLCSAMKPTLKRKFSVICVPEKAIGHIIGKKGTHLREIADLGVEIMIKQSKDWKTMSEEVLKEKVCIWLRQRALRPNPTEVTTFVSKVRKTVAALEFGSTLLLAYGSADKLPKAIAVIRKYIRSALKCHARAEFFY